MKETGGNVVLDELPPVFYTYTPSTVKAIRIILRSLVEKSLKKAKDGVAEPVHVEATYERIGETEQAVVVLQAHDGPVNVEEGLHNLLRGDTQSALFLLRGFARWKMEVPFADGVVRAYEVTRKAKIEPENSELPGFRHVLTFYQ